MFEVGLASVALRILAPDLFHNNGVRRSSTAFRGRALGDNGLNLSFWERPNATLSFSAISSL